MDVRNKYCCLEPFSRTLPAPCGQGASVFVHIYCPIPCSAVLSRRQGSKQGTGWSGKPSSAKDGATPRHLECPGRSLGKASSTGHREDAERPACRRDRPPPGPNAHGRPNSGGDRHQRRVQGAATPRPIVGLPHRRGLGVMIPSRSSRSNRCDASASRPAPSSSARTAKAKFGHRLRPCSHWMASVASGWPARITHAKSITVAICSSDVLSLARYLRDSTLRPPDLRPVRPQYTLDRIARRRQASGSQERRWWPCRNTAASAAAP